MKRPFLLIPMYDHWLRAALLKGVVLCVAIFCGVLVFSPTDAQAISIYILNGQKANEQGAVLEVTTVKGINVSGNQKMLIMPGERKHVYARHVTGFVLARVYGDHKQLFDIKCPEDPRIKDVLTIGLENVEKNTVGAGCEVIRKGSWTLESGTSWQPARK